MEVLMSASKVHRGAGVALLALLAFVMMAGTAWAETASFTTQGCKTWKVPAGVVTVGIQATGAAGEHAFAGTAGFAGLGDGYSATLPGLVADEELDVCVDFGGGSGGSEAGSGGGASGVSMGTNFEHPVLVAAGGGGAGTDGEEEVGAGGNAGEPGHLGSKEIPFPEHVPGGGGGAGTSAGPGKGGAAGTEGRAGSSGEAFSASGPGHGGAGASFAVTIESSGGGGGAGYNGGGGGGNALFAGGGGGGGGSDFCGGTASGCAQHAKEGTNDAAGSEPGDAQVTLTYTVRTTTGLTTSLSGGGQSGEKITVKEGTAVTDQATLSGENAASATGKVTYKLYSDNQCATEVASAGEVAVSAGKVPASEAKSEAAGTYYWQVSYSGDSANEPSKSTCGSETETVTATPAYCGKTTVGKSSSPLEANFKRVNKCTLPVNASVSELSIYLTPNSHSGQQLIKGIFYADSKGKPAGLLGTTIQLTFTGKSPAGWYHLAFPTPLNLTPGKYWIGMITGASQYVGAEHYDSVTNAQDSNTNSYSAGPSNPFGLFNKGNERMSLYATYTRTSD